MAQNEGALDMSTLDMTNPPLSLACLSAIDPSRYTPHELHRGERAWTETNCYIDVWIEVLNTLGVDPVACMPMVFAIDFDGDQWTFFKPPHEDLFTLYGIDVQELNVYRNLLENASEQLRRGRLVLAEADAFYLPDTSGTDYRKQHTKTTIGIQEIDVQQQMLGYFHNSSYHRLRGEDFVRLFRTDLPPDPTFMPFFAEFVRFDRLERRSPPELTRLSVELLRKHLQRKPRQNPISEFRGSFIRDVEYLKTAGLERYHLYAFATLRQLGAAFELGAYYVRWLERHDQQNFDTAAADFDAISTTTKSLLMKTARAVNAKRPVDFQAMLDELEERWDTGMASLSRGIG